MDNTHQFHREIAQSNRKMEAAFLHEQILVWPIHSSHEQVQLEIKNMQTIIEREEKEQ